MDFIGKITFIWSEEKVGQNETPKVTFVVEEEWKEYPSSMAIDLRKEKIDEIKSIKVWDSVKVSVNFRTREYNWKYFNSISAWRISKSDGATSSQQEPADDRPF